MTRPSKGGKYCILINVILKSIDEFKRVYSYSSSRHQDIYPKLIECFNNYIPINLFQSLLVEDDFDSFIKEIITDGDFEKNETEAETIEPKEEFKNPQGYNSESPNVFLNNLNEKRMNDLQLQAMFKLSRHSNFSIFVISQDYYELPKNLLGPLETCITLSNRTFSEMFKISNKMKPVWICHLMNINY